MATDDATDQIYANLKMFFVTSCWYKINDSNKLLTFLMRRFKIRKGKALFRAQVGTKQHKISLPKARFNSKSKWQNPSERN